MPDGTIAAADGANPYWTLLTPGEPAALFRYNGPEPATINIGDVITDVAMLAPAPPTSTSPPPPSTTTSIPTSTLPATR